MCLGIGYWLFGEKWCAFWVFFLLVMGCILTIRHIVIVFLKKYRNKHDEHLCNPK